MSLQVLLKFYVIHKTLLFYWYRTHPIMASQTYTQNHPAAKEYSSLAETHSETIKDQLTQLQSTICSPTPTNFSFQNQIQSLQKQESVRNKPVPWSPLQQLYYFDSTLRFVIENPYLTVSWATWKPPQFFDYIEQKMTEIFGNAARNGDQCKSKDQNLKKQYYLKGNKKLDILKVALQKLIHFVNNSKRFLFRKEQIEKAMQRCDETLKIYREELGKMEKPKTYQVQLAGLVRYIQSVQSNVCKVQPDNGMIITFENKEMDAPIMTFPN